ncbi:tryptophan synthase beta subunit-like PLP-dependent enzyme [Clavulina sp. PMI_390]|nr:tryptophan synthase beta subunit-like PLP-dependent enzyme [Clavulina sp. PMI_390]
MSSLTEYEGRLWERTPLIFSDSISARLNANVYLKLENLQPSQCFKQRTQSLLAHKIYSQPTHGAGNTHFVIASGGNAALCLAVACSQLEGAKLTVFVPEKTRGSALLDELGRYGAIVVIHGKTFPEAVEKALEFVKTNPDTVFMPASDHPTLCEGASSIVDEIEEQLPVGSGAPDAIVCSVGGGSLIGGLMIGCDRCSWASTRIIAMEAIGADTLYHSVLLNESPIHANKLAPGAEVVQNEEYSVQLVTRMPTSKATSLGARVTSANVLSKILSRRKQEKNAVTCVDVPDELGMEGCLGFADEHKTLVDLACGVALAMAYKPKLFREVFAKELDKPKKPTVVFVVCGGFLVALKDMLEYSKHLQSREGQEMEAFVESHSVVI